MKETPLEELTSVLKVSNLFQFFEKPNKLTLESMEE